jgi:hypothetical protein
MAAQKRPPSYEGGYDLLSQTLCNISHHQNPFESWLLFCGAVLVHMFLQKLVTLRTQWKVCTLQKQQA